MYYPFLRGKQFELLAIRHLAESSALTNVIPILEPVRPSMPALKKTVQATIDADADLIVIVNPAYGVHARDNRQIRSLLNDDYAQNPSVKSGILLREYISVAEAELLARESHPESTAYIHAGFEDPDLLIERMGDNIMLSKHIFIDGQSSRAYQRRFSHATKILLRDRFIRRNNRDYPTSEFFSDLHHSFPEHGMDGFGDFLIVGDEFSEGGGPAYAVAIHITFIDPTRNNDMHIYHFVSDSNDTPANTAGKFAEALNKMMARLARPNHHILETSAIAEFRHLHRTSHFPNLGYVKKLCMIHHAETLQDFLNN